MTEKSKQIARAFAVTRPGSLHRALGVPAGERIPVAKLREAARWTGRRSKLAKKAAMVLNFRRARLVRRRQEAA
jgi:hypothetical protein